VLVPQGRRGGEQLVRLDDDRRLADPGALLDVARQRIEIGYDATLRSS
jgi:hypothetical protein